MVEGEELRWRGFGRGVLGLGFAVQGPGSRGLGAGIRVPSSVWRDVVSQRPLADNVSP